MILLTFLLQTIRIAIPYLLAAAGGVMSERVGIIALGLEGMMLAGAFGAALGSYYGGSPWIGLAGALAAGAMVTAVLAVATLRFKANQVVVGIAINLLVVAATRFYLRRIFDSASNFDAISLRIGFLPFSLEFLQLRQQLLSDRRALQAFDDVALHRDGVFTPLAPHHTWLP